MRKEELNQKQYDEKLEEWVKKQDIIKLLQQLANEYKKYGDQTERCTVEECISVIQRYMP